MNNKNLNNLALTSWVLMDSIWACDYDLIGLIFGCISIILFIILYLKEPTIDNKIATIWVFCNSIWCLSEFEFITNNHLFFIFKLGCFAVLITLTLFSLKDGHRFDIRK